MIYSHELSDYYAIKGAFSPNSSNLAVQVLLTTVHILQSSSWLTASDMADFLHKSLRAMKLDEEEPLTLPDSPRFRVYDENSLSILGRLLNPECQSMSRMIDYMPTAWRVYDRVRGIALSRDRFQFVFQRKEDLETVLRDRPWSYNHWAMVLERWTDNPPENFLNSMDLWIRIRHIPAMYFKIDTMYKLASEVGKVEEIAYDPKVSHTKDYIRARITFNVDNPAKASRRLNIPTGGSVLIEFEYEKIHKRCFHCLKLTHEKIRCPMLKKDSRSSKVQTSDREEPQPSNQLVKSTGAIVPISSDGPPGFPSLFPELSEQDRRSAMMYVSHANETERNARIQRVRQAITDSAATPPAILTKITPNLDKGKGHVFEYPDISSRLQWPQGKTSSTSSAPVVPWESEGESESSTVSLPVSLPVLDVTTGFQLGKSSKDPTAGDVKGGKKHRRRPPSWKRKTQVRAGANAIVSAQNEGSIKDNGNKRKPESFVPSSSERSTKKQEISVASGLKPLPSQ
ncbi:hypothetical protein Bca101_023432 [Brassica carinata]